MSIIGDKSKAFAIQIIRFHQYLRDTKREFIISGQLLRSGTSIGANVREAKNAQSEPDFIHKMSIALKEADETAYWLELLKESGTITEEEFSNMYNNNIELIKTLTSIVKTTKLKTRK